MTNEEYALLISTIRARLTGMLEASKRREPMLGLTTFTEVSDIRNLIDAAILGHDDEDEYYRPIFDGLCGEGYWDSCKAIRDANKARNAEVRS